MLVHFPIALLTLYAVTEILPVARIIKGAPWTAIKSFAVIIGALMAAPAAIITGLIEESRIPVEIPPPVELHKDFALWTFAVFGVIAVGYLIRALAATFADKIPAWLRRVADFLGGQPLRSILAIGGLILVTITGALGGSMVFGSDVDPVVKFISGLFF